MVRMHGLTIGHTADVDESLLAGARALMDDAFDDMTDDDWEHALGGIHVLAVEDSAVVGHASLVQRRLLHDGRALRTGYVEAVAVRADRRRQGLGGELMDVVERYVRGAYDVGALGATDEGVAFYSGRGWQVWRGELGVLSPDGPRATPDEQGGVFVLPGAAPLDLDGALTCDWRAGDVW